MPRGDGTGPRGEGPRTGRELGYCAGYDSPGFTKGAPRGGGGFGRGRGFRRYRTAPAFGRGRVPARTVQPNEEQELQMLDQDKEAIENEVEALEKELEDIKNRIKELKGE
ncbi:MAG: DUF5320 domain-containing protein [Candidatus Aenigmatarchaeota archaeon]